MDYSSIIQSLAIAAVPILLAITFHEVAHGFVAYKLGDQTAKMMGRLTLNPLPHIDLFGTILMPVLLYFFTNGQFVFGYAKPVPINPRNFKNPKRDMALSAAAGPISNLLLAAASILVAKYFVSPLSHLMPNMVVTAVLNPLVLILEASMIVNAVLATLNMIPIPPLDGGRVLMGFLPMRYAVLLERIEPFGFMIVILLLATNMAQHIMVPVINTIVHMLRML